MPQRRVAFEVTGLSILKVLLAAIAVWAWFQLWQFFIALLVSIFLAVTFEPFARWLEEHRIPRWLASLFPVLILMAVIAGFVIAASSTLTNQIKLVGANLSGVEHRLQESAPALAPVLNRIHSQNNTAAVSRYVASVLLSTGRALVLIAIGLILTVYLLAEREKTLRWAILFVPKRHRPKMQETLFEIRSVISAYILGNLLTASFAIAFVFATLTALKVPAALVLALLAGICDFIPLLGFVLSGVPAVLLAATVSKTAAIATVIVYIGYHFVETYLIAPRLYGHRLQLSNVAVIIGFAVGAELGGVIGAMLALPLAATYPVVERIWLAEYLKGDVAEQHQRLVDNAARE